MPHDPESLAASVVLLVQKAMTPVLERLATAEQANRDLQTRVQEWTGFRERLAVVETKAALPFPVPPEIVPTDLTPVLERLASAESRLQTVGDLRDRVITVETKSVPMPDLAPLTERLTAVDARLSMLGDLRDRVVTIEAKTLPEFPTVPDLSPVVERVAAAEARLAVLGDVRDRLILVETKAVTPQVVVPTDTGLDDLRERLVTLETRAAGPSPTDMGLVDVRERVTHLEHRLTDDTHTKELSIVRERLGILEVREQRAGPAGTDGAPGKDGAPGRDGTLEQLKAVYDGERTITLMHKDGTPMDGGVIRFPLVLDRGLYNADQTYEPGDGVTWGGSFWIAKSTTVGTKPQAGGTPQWRLAVKEGREGRPGVDGKDGKPGRDAIVKEGATWGS